MIRMVKARSRLLVCLTLLLAFVAQQWHQQPSAFLPAGDYATEAALADIMSHGHSHDWDEAGEPATGKSPSAHDLVDHEHPTVMMFELTYALVVPGGNIWQADFPEARTQQALRVLRPPIV
ncbi:MULTISPECIES: hypothetical protein [Thalassospira]|uniref:Cobalt transporter n=2 Tax=Thalassospira TaxID=168934 RepID=A0A367WBB2_9PROT|nr:MULTISPECIES: hypothetical protein [Thalassospira]MDG4718031.1 hypothetical protein [Thalassospira sp. FZY0004]RCK37812.1 hypothetical protein TH19_07170 [Thalassospira profundimaris]